MNSDLEQCVEDTWVALLSAKNTALDHVEESLKKNKLPAFSWYDVLLELENADIKGLRPYEIEQQLLLSQYGLSRLLVRMEKEGYLQKTRCEVDGRGHNITITQQGRQIRKDMWRVYSKAIQTSIGDKLSETQCRKLTVMLEPLQN